MKKLKNLHTFRDATGTFRCYVRRAGMKSIPIPGKIGSRAFMAAYNAAMNKKFAVRPPKPRPNFYEDAPHIYFLRGYGQVKVGTTRAPEKRIAEIQVSSPVPLTPLLVVPGGVVLERQIHRRFHHLRRHGEWFKATPEFLAFVDALRNKREQELANGTDQLANAGEIAQQFQ